MSKKNVLLLETIAEEALAILEVNTQVFTGYDAETLKSGFSRTRKFMQSSQGAKGRSMPH
jgi:D-3-phosphoglycerate dehydrogenase